MSQALIQILEKSACLTKTQLIKYATGGLIEEEIYAVETHLNSCVMCSAAVDGMLLHVPESVAAVTEMDGSFLKKYFEELKPQIHLNSVAPAMHLRNHKRKETDFQFPIRTLARITAAGLAALGIFWILNKLAEAAPDEIAATPLSVQPVQVAMPDATPLPAVQSSLATPITQTGPQIAATASEENGPSATTTTKQPGEAPATQAVIPVTEKTNELSKQKPEEKAVVPVVADSEKQAVPKKENKPEAPAPQPPAPAPTPKSEPAPVSVGGSATSEQRQFQHTIQTYKKDLKDPDQEKRNLARLVSASAYQGLGQSEKAVQLLEQIIDEGGPHKAEARRTLRKMRRER